MIMDKFKPNHREITDWIGNQRITWCGPYSVATVAGTSYERAYQTLKLIRGKRHCKGVSNANIAAACKKLGIKGKWKKLEKRTKLANFLPTLEDGKVYIVQITKHVLVIDTRDRTTIDNQHREWIAMESTKHANKLAHAYYEVENPKFETVNEPWLFEKMAASA